MDEASHNSFYEDDLPVVSGTTFEVRSHLKDKGLFTFKSTCQQSAEETTEPIRNEQRGKYDSDFTVPVCDDQKCQLATQQDLDHTTSVPTCLPGEYRTVQSIEMCDERPSMADHFKKLKIISNEYQCFAECTTLPSLPLVKSVYDSYKTSKDAKEKLEASQNELYLNWNALSHFSKRMNKIPAGWPAIGVKSFGTENKITCTPHQPTLSLFTMVKQAHLLSEEQLKQIIKESEFNEYFVQCYRPTLKRCSPSREAFGSPIEKFSKTVQDVEIENSRENGEFFSQEETSGDCKDASRIYADQEVPVQDEEVSKNSKGQAMEVVDEKMSDNPVSIVNSFGDRPSFNSKSSNLNFVTSTGDNLHIENAPFYEEPKTVPCTKSFCWKFSQKHLGNVLTGNPLEKEGSSAYGAAKASLMNAEQGSCETRLTDQPGKNTDLLAKQQTMMITNEEGPSHNEVQVMLSQSSITYNIACKYPPLPEKAPNNTGLCLSLHAIDERALITNPLDGLDCSPLRSRKDLQAEILLYEREQVDDWLHQCDVFPPNTSTSQDLESFSSNIPVKYLGDRPPRHAECFDRIPLSDSKPRLLQASHSEAPQENMKTEGPINQEETEITNFSGQRNHDINELGPPEMKDEKKSINSHQDKSDQFRTEIESKIFSDLDGPELLQFAMILVQGALKKTQIVPRCNEQLKRDKKYMSMITPAFLWRSALANHGQTAPALGPTNDEASNERGDKVDEDGENTYADSKEGPSHLIRPLPKTTCNRPLRLGLSRKHSNKRLHPYFKKHSNEKPR